MKYDFVIGNSPYQEEIQNKRDRVNPMIEGTQATAFPYYDRIKPLGD